MDHRRLIPQARHVKQIVLWMDIIRSEQFAAQLTHFLSWPGTAVRRTASLPLAYVPAIRVLDAQKTWMPGTSPGMTNSNAMHEDGNDVQPKPPLVIQFVPNSWRASRIKITVDRWRFNV
ncbi:MAG TPA: hypothetical protein VN831_01550 [Bradyrhizobium sp.]|nr:hypothetical protein [Bradyrhizobium sp.]